MDLIKQYTYNVECEVSVEKDDELSIGLEEMEYMDLIDEQIQISKATDLALNAYNVNNDIVTNGYEDMLSNLKILGISDIRTGNEDAKTLLKKTWRIVKTAIIESIRITAELMVKAVNFLFRVITGKTVFISQMRKRVNEIRTKRLSRASTALSDKVADKIRKQLFGVGIVSNEISYVGLFRYFNVVKGLDVKEYNNVALIAALEDNPSEIASKVKTIFQKLTGIRIIKQKNINIPDDPDEILDIFESLLLFSYYNNKIGLSEIDKVLDKILPSNLDKKINIISLNYDKVVLGVRMYKNPDTSNIIKNMVYSKGDENLTLLNDAMNKLKSLTKYEKISLNPTNTNYKNFTVKVLDVDEVDGTIREIELMAKHYKGILDKYKRQFSKFNKYVNKLLEHGDSLQKLKGEVYRNMVSYLLNTEFKFIIDSFNGLISMSRNVNNYAIYDYLDECLKLYEVF